MRASKSTAVSSKSHSVSSIERGEVMTFRPRERKVYREEGICEEWKGLDSGHGTHVETRVTNAGRIELR